LHCMQIHSLAGSSLAGLRHGAVAFRSPHHSASMAAVLGSGRMPGEISLAHEGVLFLDELPEFRRDLLEALREPLESGEVHIARAGGRVVWPARAVLVAACNNCPCGWSGSRFRMCRCQSNKPAVYRARLSGPLLDRIDIHVNMPESAAGRFSCVPKPGQAAGSTGPAVVVSSADLRSRVIGAREFATLRSRRLGITSEVANARLDPGSVHLACGWPDGGVVVRQLMEQADSDRSSVHIPEVVRSISSRGLGRALRVARTLADVDRAEAVGYEHFRQALMWQGEAAARMRGEHLESAGSWRSKSG
jgi:magnesium chelatase family protein